MMTMQQLTHTSPLPRYRQLGLQTPEPAPALPAIKPAPAPALLAGTPTPAPALPASKPALAPALPAS